jgi:hypothetical protein
MNTTLIAYLHSIPASSIWAVIILAILIAPWVTRARNKVVRASRALSWIVLGFVMGLWARDFLSLVV